MIIENHNKYIVNSYDPIDLIVSSASGRYMYDNNGVRYLDFFNGTSVSNLGHCDQEVIKAVGSEIENIGCISRLYHTKHLSDFGKKANEVFGYDKVMPMVTGADAVETAIKMARYYGYTKLGVPEDEAIVLIARNNYHGRSITATGFSDDVWSQEHFGPFESKGFEYVNFDDIDDLKNKASNPNVVGYLFEPIQMMGVIIPSPGYYLAVRNICNDTNTLMITDEVQTGLGRTGYMLATEYENVRADIVVICKSLTNGMFPMSAVLVDDCIVDNFPTGKHGSTFSGHPLACVAATKTLSILTQSGLTLNSQHMGQILIDSLNTIPEVKEVRGRGLMLSIVVDNPKDVVPKLLEEKIVTKVICGSIRLSPPLLIDKNDINIFINKLKKVLTTN